jgi:hypothetical protein
MKIYEVENLKNSRDFLSSTDDKVILTNPQGSTRYYGMRVIDHIFKTLQEEFPEKVSNVIVNAYDDYPAFVTAHQLGYKQIQYFNRMSV